VKKYVLDANALVRSDRRAPGFEAVASIIQQAKAKRARLSISVVNLCEVLSVLARHFDQEQTLQYIAVVHVAWPSRFPLTSKSRSMQRFCMSVTSLV